MWVTITDLMRHCLIIWCLDGQRMSIGDPAFVKNVTDLQTFYLQKSTSKELADRISLSTTFPSYYYNPENYTAQR